MFTAALFSITKTWERLRCPSVGEGVNKLWCIQTTECYSVLTTTKKLSRSHVWTPSPLNSKRVMHMTIKGTFGDARWKMIQKENVFAYNIHHYCLLASLENKIIHQIMLFEFWRRRNKWPEILGNQRDHYYDLYNSVFEDSKRNTFDLASILAVFSS